MRVNCIWADEQTRDHNKHKKKKIHQWYEKKTVEEKYPILNYN